MFSRVARSFKKTVQLYDKNKKYFDLHEYQSKDIMRKYGIKVQNGKVATTVEGARQVASELDPSGGLILKAQVQAGGRGKGHLTSGLKGGVKFCKTPEEVANYTKQMLGYNLITHQTTKAGLEVKAVLVHEGVDIKREIYLAFILDRTYQSPALIASKEGGVEIETVPHDKIIVEPISIKNGLTDDVMNRVIHKLDLDHVADQARQQLRNLYNMFQKLDCTQLEINPWAVDPTNTLYCIDGKINIDDNAKFRQAELVQMRRESVGSEQVDPHEEKAVEAGLNYVALDGNIGCMVNGAGLAMATMDIIKLYGGEPANFLDVGGGANVQQIATAFEILNSHPSVQTILINIFGGILKCDVLADGIIQAAQMVSLKKTLVVRLSGTNSDIGKQKLKEFSAQNPSYKFITGEDMDDAAQKAVKTIKK